MTMGSPDCIFGCNISPTNNVYYYVIPSDVDLMLKEAHGSSICLIRLMLYEWRDDTTNAPTIEKGQEKEHDP